MRREQLLTVVLSVLATLIVLAPVAYVAYAALPPRVATVDLQKLIEEEQQRTLGIVAKSGSLTEEQRATVEQLTIEFAKKLSAAVEQLGASCRCVIVNKAALLGGRADDYTDQVRESLKP